MKHMVSQYSILKIEANGVQKQYSYIYFNLIFFLFGETVTDLNNLLMNQYQLSKCLYCISYLCNIFCN